LRDTTKWRRAPITHALRFPCPHHATRLRPASAPQRQQPDESEPAAHGHARATQGKRSTSRFQLDVQVILTGLRKYGMTQADNGGGFFVSGAPDPRWNDANIDTLKRIKGSDFEVVRMTGMVAGTP
jgi:hypothetical protein